MSDLKQSSVALLEEAIDRKIRNAQKGRDTTLATVTRVEPDGTTWVRVYGGADETPVRRMTSSAQVGDVINVVFSGLSCMGVGNVTNPSASVVQVENVEVAARGAALAAQTAWAHADDAAVAAQTAWSHADEAADAASSANRSANSALTQLSIVEDVAGTLDWISKHGQYVATTDTTVVADKVYFEKDGDDYTPVVSPDPSANPRTEGWYVLDVTDSQSDFIMAHLAVTSRGLWVLPSGIGSATDEQHAAGYKVLLSSDGMYVYDSTGAMVIKYGENIEPSTDRPFYIGDPNSTSYILFTPASGSTPASISIGGSVKVGTSKTLSELLAEVDAKAARGTGILKVTTAPSSYTTQTGGFTPTYRIALSTVESQAGVDEVIVGDVIEYSYYHYPVGYVDSSYAYTGARTSIRGATGTAGGRWYSGTGITGTSTTATIFSGSGVSSAVVGDMYLNTDTNNTYRCTTAGNASTAKWVYVANIEGEQGIQGETGPQGPQGEQGIQGPAGTSVTVSKVEYATSTTESQPSSGWSTTAPSTVAEGSWLWVKTTYSDGTDSVTRAKQGKSGTNGTSYYTHVRYSASSDGTNHAATPSSTTKYIGIYTGTSSTAPSSKSSYTWSKYVGEDGSAGHSPSITTSYDSTNHVTTIYADGTSIGTVADGEDGTTPTITASKSGGTTTVKVDGTTIATINDGTSVTVSKVEYGTSSSASTSPSSWSTTVPTAITKGKWLWVKTTYSDNSTATTKSYVGTDGEDGKSVYVASTSKTDGVTTVTLSDGTTTTTIQIADGEDGENGQPGAAGDDSYVHFAWANSADGATDFSTSVSAGKLYMGVYSDNTLADSQTPTDYSWTLIKGETGDAAQWYYGTALTHTSGTATLATSSTAGVVVGAMYLNKDTSLCYKCTAISGSTATWTYAGNLTDGVIDNINIGGRNLLRKTGNLVESDLFLARSTVADGVITLTPTTTAAYAKFLVDYLDFSEYGSGIYTLSFEAKAGTSSYTSVKGPLVYVGFQLPSATGVFATSNSKYRGNTLSPNISSDWTRYVKTISVPGDLTTGTNDALVAGSNLTVEFGMTGSYAPMQVRNVKLERGNVATDWTPAPEDQTTYVDNSVYQSSQPNLSPFFSYQPPTDTRYWVLATNQTTNVYDGWMTFDMSAASQSDRVIHIRPKRQEWVKPGGRYTLLVELADIVASGTVQWMPRANNGIDQIAFDGSTDTLPSKSFYVSGTALSNAISDSTRTSLVTVVIMVKANATFSGKVRVSLYEGDYSGPYKPYVGSLLYGSAADSVEYIVGTQTKATNVWTGVTKDSSLAAGKTIAYYLPYAGNSSAATLNLTLSGGGTTGAKNVKYNSNNSAANNVTTHYGAGSVIQMTYDGTYWRVAASYYDTGGISNARYRTQWANAIKAETAITASRIICGTASGYKNIAASASFDLAYPLLYATAAITAGSTGTDNYLTYNGINASSNGTITAGAANKMLYLKGTVNGNTFTIASSGFLTTNVPTTDDGSAYIPLGVMYSPTNVYFNSSKELYCYKDGAFGPVSIREAAEAAKVAGNYIVETASNDVWIHSENHGPNSSGVATADTYGWRIGSVFELVRAGATYIKMWVENSVAKLRLGLDTSGHVLLDSTGMEVKNSSTSLAKFGTTARVGLESSGHVELDSTGMEVFTNASTSVAQFGSTARVGNESSGHAVLSSTGMEVFTNASTSVAKFAASLIEIGKNATSAVIKFCNGKGTIEYNADDSEPSSSDYGASTSYFEIKGADLRLRGTSRAALYSHYSNGSNIGRKTSVITKPKQLYAFSQESTNLVNGEGTWTTSEMLMSPVSVAFLTETFTLNGINVRDASGLFDRGTLPVARGGTGKTSGTFYGATRIYSSTATCATFTLTSSVANYTWLTIQYKGNDGFYTTTTVFNNKGALNVALFVIESTANASVNIKRVTYAFSGTSATVKTYGEMDGPNSATASKNVTVTGVWGWV